MFNISAKYFQNSSRNGKVMDQTRKQDSIFDIYFLSVTLSLELQTWVFRATNRRMIVNISLKSFQNPSRNGKVMDRTRNQDSIFEPLTSKCDLDLEATDQFLRATHRLMMVNISAKSFKIHQGMAKLWTGHEKKYPISDL